MDNREVEILLIEDDMNEAEKVIRIFRKNNLADKLIHLRNGREADDFIFCTGVFAKRNFEQQPKTIFLNVKEQHPNDVRFLNRVAANERTKNITVVVLAIKEEEASRQSRKISSISRFGHLWGLKSTSTLIN